MKRVPAFFLKPILWSLLGVYFYIPVNSQNLIDINVMGSNDLQAHKSNNLTVREIFKEVECYRLFDYNQQLVALNSNNIGDTLLLNFFNDKQYKSVILNAGVNYHGRTSIISKILDTEFGYCYMIVSGTTISISAELPQKNEYFFASVKEGQAYLSQVKKSELDATALPGHDPLIIPEQKDNESKMNEKGIDDPIIIDVLYVYTPAAAQWAASDWQVTDIFDLIDMANERSNLTMVNSLTGVTFNIVHVHQTNYVEANNINDLYRITDPNDGYMDEVHVLRDEYYADLIVFIPKVDFTGGVAWLLNNENGFYPDYYAVSLSRVQQSSWTYTVVHEIGHNMGCHHHAEQNVQPGPGLFYFSSGWRGTVSGEHQCSVMTYAPGIYFGDGQDHIQIPYLSSPDIVFDGVPIGDTWTDNALTLKLTKTVTANYRIPPDGSTLTVYPTSLDFGNVVISNMLQLPVSVTGVDLTNGITYVKSGADFASFYISETTSWNDFIGGTLNILFAPAQPKNYSAIITFSSLDAANKTVTLSGKGVPATYNITTTANGNGTIDPEGIITVDYLGSVGFRFYPNDNYRIVNVLVDGVANDNAIAAGSYLFSNVTENHTIHVAFDGWSVNENDMSNVQIFSYRNYLYILNPEIASQTVEILDLMGRMVYHANVTDVETIIPLQVSNGIYTVRTTSPEGKMAVKKITLFKE